ncbi:hypothetical protein ACI3QN_12980, partial [Propionibacterium freudenreichii]|uniref:hypothetical protein n=1 Tax=Propionibacterium freudenreichii TaxID=1744 RepID=UPI0038542496
MVNPFFGKREHVTEREKPTDFLNSVKTEYNYPKNQSTFDFSLITNEEQNALYEIIQHVRHMQAEWTSLDPYRLKDGKTEIVNSWK